MRPLLALCVALLLLPNVLATTFVDSATGDPVTDGLLRIEYDGVAADYLLADARLPDSTASGLLVLARTGDGATYDRYAQLPAGTVPQAIILHPCGLLMGELEDAQDNLLVHRELVVSCAAVEEHATTAAAGRFRLFLPVGECTVSAAADSHAGSAEVAIAEGEVTSLALTVDRPVRTARFPLLPVLAALVVAAVLAVLIHASLSRKGNGIGRQETAKAPQFLVERHRAALKEKERCIVDELLGRGGSARLSELRSATGIPRTSLLRCLEGLEQRGLLLKTERGRRQAVELVKK